jgi:hypothetical protein
MSNTEAEILACEERLRLADASADPDTSAVLNELLADDVIMIGPKGELYDKAFVLDAHRPPKRKFFHEVNISELMLKDLGDSVLVSCRSEFRLAEKVFSLRFARVWNRAGAGWKVALGTVTILP